MGELSFRIALALVAVVATAVALVLVAAAVSRRGRARASLIAAGLPLSLLAPVVAAVYASGRFLGFFGGMAHPDGIDQFVAICGSLWQLQRVAWGAFAAVCALGLLLGLVLPARPTNDTSCSKRRGLVLLLLPLLGLLVAGAATRELGRVLRVATAVMSADPNDPDDRKRADTALEAAGLPTQGSGALGATARFVAQRSLLATFGGGTAFVILLGLALTGAILSWRVGVGTAFQLVASALWLLCAAAGAVLSAGVVDPLRLP